MAFKIDTAALTALAAQAEAPDLSGINFGLLEMLELWAEREWEKKEKGLPSEWDQGVWVTARGAELTGTACGTACCLAGKAILVTPGVTFTQSSNDYTPADLLNAASGIGFDNVLVPAAMVPDDVADWAEKVLQNGQEYYSMFAQTAGRVILGLNHRESTSLFSGANGIEDVRRIVADIRSGAYRRNRTRFENVPVVTVPVCNADAEDVVREIVGTDSADFYTLYGNCELPENHEGDHFFNEH